MKIYACSDLHISPEVPLDFARPFLDEAAERADYTLFCGDIFEGSWYPLQESVEHENGQEMWALIKAQKNPILIRGNHDWTLHKYRPDESVEVHTFYYLDADGITYYATHGWAEYDFVFGRLAPIYDKVLPLLSVFAKLWTAWKTPGTLKRKKHTTQYWRSVRGMSNKAIYHSIRLNENLNVEETGPRYVPIWGHTHHRHSDRYEHWLAINCGDFVEARNGGIVIQDRQVSLWQKPGLWALQAVATDAPDEEVVSVSTASAVKKIPDWQSIHQAATVVDVHAHPSLKVSLWNRALTSRLRSSRTFDPFGIRCDFDKMQRGGVDVLWSTVHPPEKGILDECRYLRLLRFLMPFNWRKVFGRSPFQVTMKMLDAMEEQVRKAVNPATGQPYARVVYSVQELDDLLNRPDDRPLAVIHNIEGAHALDGDLDNLDMLAARGVAYMTLAHFYENEAVHSIFPFPESVQKLSCFRGDRNVALGLKAFGTPLIEKMIELGIVLDIAHCTPVARRQIYDIVGVRRPIIASHVGAYAINPSPYNLTDDEIRFIADGGGVAAVIFMNYWLMPHETKRGLNFVAHTINHFVNVGGIDCVAIGTDFDGFTDPPDDLKDASELPKLTQRLLAEGYDQEQIAKIWGGNALRVLREGWGNAR